MLLPLRNVQILIGRLSILLIVFAICRIFFYVLNKDVLPVSSLSETLVAMCYGVRYDISAILFVNLPFIILHLIPFARRESVVYQTMLKGFFLVLNGIVILIEGADAVYFRYGLKRVSTHEIGLLNDTNVLPRVAWDLWFVFLLILVLLIGSAYLYRKIGMWVDRKADRKKDKAHHLSQWALTGMLAPVLFVGCHTAFREGSLTESSTSGIVQHEQLSELALNSTFSLIYSFLHRRLIEPQYFDDEELTTHYNILHDVKARSPVMHEMNKPPLNICVVILESFSKEYIGFFTGNESYTPFLDSLLGEGLSFTNAYSNGKSSNQGIVAISASIPVLMPEPFISSLYQDNDFTGIGELLGQCGYRSYFFHGANNHSMGFDQFMQRAGFDGFYGRNEYGLDCDFDGNWGVYDEPFLHWTCHQMSSLPQPFYTQIFTLSSHYPYAIPPQYANVFKKGSIPMLEVIGYTDFALRQFFREAQKQPWYDNTLFILTADHPGPPMPGHAFYQHQLGAHSTWLLFYHPDGRYSGIDEDVVQQTDLLPTILDLVGYTGAYQAFGHSVFDTTAERHAFNLHAGTYMILDKDYCLFHSGTIAEGLYRYQQDSLFNKNLVLENHEEAIRLENTLKAIIQTHHHAMITNQLKLPIVQDYFN